jgi:RsiW-degrading membrane proteinase PrsW (M82 family)
MDLTTIFFALIGGIVPALIWVWFWNREDAKNPEPKRMIIMAFVAGMVAVAAVIPLQKFALGLFSGTLVVLVWAALEEIVKFVLAYITVLKNKETNEPIDPLIYMVTVALGFAAAENALFLVDPITNSGFVESILTGNFRFLGATLLHILSSSVIGVALGLAFYKNAAVRIWYGLAGLILAVVLHGAFNFFILRSDGSNLMRVFAFVWIGLVALLIAFEKVKRVRKNTGKMRQ